MITATFEEFIRGSFLIVQKEVGLNHDRYWKSVNIIELSQLEIFTHSLGLPNIKYNCVMSFLCQMYCLYDFCSIYILVNRLDKTNI